MRPWIGAIVAVLTARRPEGFVSSAAPLRVRFWRIDPKAERMSWRFSCVTSPLLSPRRLSPSAMSLRTRASG